MQVRVVGEELGCEATISVAYDEGVFPVEEGGEVVGSAVLEGWAQGEIFEVSIGSCDCVEVGLSEGGFGHLRPRERKSRGVRSARSAAALAVRGERWRWVRWRMRRVAALRVAAAARGW